ncbi:MAG: hypothetical protein J6R08_06995 [Opitutales bacterium]|nr:hypothetical protein [Opitutales bacterium]
MKKSVIMGLAAIFLIVSAFVVLVEIKRNSDSGLNDFPAQAYIENPKSFAGNSYKLNVQIDSQLAYAENVGRILLVKMLEKNENVPVFTLANIKNFNPMAGQKYSFCVKVADDGVLNLLSFEKL